MTFSIGQNFFNDLLESSDKRTHNDQKAIELTYLLEKRLCNFWKNNDKPVLLKSKEFSGMKNLLGEPVPLGGEINWQECGIDNAPGSCKHGCSDEYPFWGSVKENEIDKKENFENINNIVEQPEIIENFTISNKKENFQESTLITIFIIFIVFILCIYLIFKYRKNF
jgi:hypothetical protein